MQIYEAHQQREGMETLGSLNLVSWFSQRATFSIRSSSTANIKMENAMQAILKL
jgi:hypothetical protein